MDSGSYDGTIEYFSSIHYERKSVYRLEKNLGANYAMHIIQRDLRAKYLAVVANDCIVTKNWLDNLLRCMKSDSHIGMVSPVLSNVSNFQEVDIGEYHTLEEMQELAAAFNVSDPMKWEERPRLISVCLLIRTEVFDSIGHYFDLAFFHDFSEDDLAVRMRRAGYSIWLCRDTYVAHNHPIEERDKKALEASTKAGLSAFYERYGLYAIEDMNFLITDYIEEIDLDKDREDKVKVLGLDVRSGSPFLYVKNRLRRDGYSTFELYAYTTELKYYADLLGYVQNRKRVFHGNGKALLYEIRQNYFDVVIEGKDINGFDTNNLSVENVFSFVAEGGYLLFPIYNVTNIYHYLRMMGEMEQLSEHAYGIDMGEILAKLHDSGASHVWIEEERYTDTMLEELSKEHGQAVSRLFEQMAKKQEILSGMLVCRYWILVRKGQKV